MIDTTKLDKWTELLLDTGRSNNLINFKNSPSSSVEVVFPLADDIFIKLDKNTKLEVYDPKIIDRDEDFFGPLDFTISLDEYKTRYIPKMKKQSQILIYNKKVNPLTALNRIFKKAKMFIEETGVNVAYMAFGFLNYFDSSDPKTNLKAPLLLVPINFEHLSSFSVSSAEDDVIVNPTLLYKLETEYHITLPSYNDEGLAVYLSKVNKLVENLNFYVTNESYLGIFSFLKISMYKDLKENANLVLQNKNIKALLREEGNDLDQVDDEEEIIQNYNDYELKNPLMELHNVVDADSSQIKAIEMAKAGHSFVLQGPPGTGKSQTITNIIAECLYDGKKVLFVSEKLAALKVVYEKLKKANLSEFCLELHSHKANKKDFIIELNEALTAEKTRAIDGINDEITIEEEMQVGLDKYALELHKKRNNIEESLYELYEDYSKYRAAPNVEYVFTNIEKKGKPFCKEVSTLLTEYVSYLPSIGYNYKNNAWYGYNAKDKDYENKLTIKKDIENSSIFLEKLVNLLQEIKDKYQIELSSVSELSSFKDTLSLVSTSKIITPSLLKEEKINLAYKNILLMEDLKKDIVFNRDLLDKCFSKEVYDFNGVNLNNKLSTDFESLFSRLFKKEYKELVVSFSNTQINNSKKLSYSSLLTYSKYLRIYQEKLNEYTLLEKEIIDDLGKDYKGLDSDFDLIKKDLVSLRKLIKKDFSLTKLSSLSPSLFTKSKTDFKEYTKKINELNKKYKDSYERLGDYFDSRIFDPNSLSVELCYKKVDRCYRELNKLENYVQFKALLTKLNKQEVLSFVDLLISKNIEKEDYLAIFNRQFYYQWIEYVINSSPTLSNFTRVSQDNKVRVFKEKDNEQFKINEVKIREKLMATRPVLGVTVPGSLVSTLIREGKKKRKQMSIRALLNECGELIETLKPCFLMSPLSVSAFLDTNNIKFDLVIFDEASQIFPQDALGAIYRAKQVIVTGDSKQMPPSNFFNASMEGSESTLSSYNDNNEVNVYDDVGNFDSILDLCSTCFPEVSLNWHYRSKYEELITFSNKNFYQNKLVTFPSSKVRTEGIGVDYYHVDGIFNRDKHTNFNEALFIVDLIYENIKKYPNRSLGVVAFSVAQQELIDQLLSKRRLNELDNEEFFNSEKDEPFFIKNLETVQGDERDTIIFSVAYAKDETNRLLFNFGPLNKEGGERRLNVAITRAKYNVILVSSMHYTEIDLARATSKGAKLLKDYLAYAELGSETFKDTTEVTTNNKYLNNVKDDLETEVMEFLKSKGYLVNHLIGTSSFKVDLGIKKAEDSDYVLAIECDGSNYKEAKNCRDRDRLREQILNNMGWKYYRIWSTDWFKNKAVAEEELLKVVEEAVGIRNHTETSTKTIKKVVTKDQFEEKVDTQTFSFKPYTYLDFDEVFRNHNYRYNYIYGVKYILETESPLSEELLLKRSVKFFNRNKVSSVVKEKFEEEMTKAYSYGINRHNGFLYDSNAYGHIELRVPNGYVREIKYISPEELAAGMLEIIKLNVKVSKDALYLSLAKVLGFSRVGNNSIYFDKAFICIKDRLFIDGEYLTIKVI